MKTSGMLTTLLKRRWINRACFVDEWRATREKKVGKSVVFCKIREFSTKARACGKSFLQFKDGKIRAFCRRLRLKGRQKSGIILIGRKTIYKLSTHVFHGGSYFGV